MRIRKRRHKNDSDNRKLIVVIYVLTLTVGIMAALAFFGPRMPVRITGQQTYSPSPSCNRTISPGTVAPSGQITVTLDIGVPVGSRFYYIDEVIPPGSAPCWTVIDDGGRLNETEACHLKTVNLSNAQDDSYTYIIQAPAAEGTYTFSGGTYQIEGMSGGAPITGDDQVIVLDPCSTEICNGINDDCDGQTDEGCDDDLDTYADDSMICSGSFLDGWGVPRDCIQFGGDCDDEPNGVLPLGADVNPGKFEDCNTFDDNCDNIIDNVAGGDSIATTYCQCYDGNPPLAQEICANGIDDDCNNLRDDQDPACQCVQGLTQPCLQQYGICSGTVETCPASLQWPGCGIAEYNTSGLYQTNETVCDTQDNDCDNVVDEGFDLDIPIGDGYFPGPPICTGYASADCDNTDPTIYPGATELCDAKDNQCPGDAGFGSIDEGHDGDGDGFFSDLTCTGYAEYDCHDGNATINPNATENCGPVDMNCNGDLYDQLPCPGAPIIVTTDYFDGRTTNFTLVSDIQDVAGLILERTGHGIIRFFTTINFTKAVNLRPVTGAEISENKIIINSSKLRFFNKSANITLFNLSFVNPYAIRNGVTCPSSICSTVNISGDNRTFNVTGFTEYEVGGTCSDGTLYGACSGSLPNYCDNGTLVNRCGTCGCNTGYDCSGDSCVPHVSSPGRPSSPGSPSGPLCAEGVELTCGPSTGNCESGTQICTGGAWGECTGAIGPINEVCNSMDDDCDGEIDEGLTCECLMGQTKECGLTTGICETGYRLCQAGSWSAACINETGPTEEICDNNDDDDCDGDTDEEECTLSTDVVCEEGEITEKCICGGKVYSEGWCYNDIQYDEDQLPPVPWEILSIIGGLVISVMILALVVMEINKFRKVQKRVGTHDQQKVKQMPGKEKKLYWVTDIAGDPRKFLNTELKIGGYVKKSSKVSDKEYWYSFYDQMSTVALRSKKELKEGYMETNAVVKVTPLNYVYVEID